MNEVSLKPVIEELENLFSKFNARFFADKLEKPVITVSPDHTRGAYGWCTGWKAWKAGEDEGHYHDILTRKRTIIGEDGKLQEVDNLPNNRLVDNQFALMVDQKTNYPVKGAIPFPGTFYGVLVKRLRHRPFKPGTRVRPPYTLPLAGLVEWQTQRIQNPPPLAYGFKSHTRHQYWGVRLLLGWRAARLCCLIPRRIIPAPSRPRKGAASPGERKIKKIFGA